VRGTRSGHPAPPFRSRGRLALQSLHPGESRIRMPCILPARPRFSPSPGSSTHRATRRVRNVTPGHSSPALSRHPNGLPPRSPPPYRRLRPTRIHPRKAPRRSSRALRHFRIPRPFFPRPLPKPRPESLASLPGSPALRVWLPSRRPKARRTLGGLFQPPTPLGFSLQSFPPPRGSSVSLPTHSPLLRFAAKPPQPCTGAPAASSPRKSRAPLRSPNG